MPKSAAASFEGVVQETTRLWERLGVIRAAIRMIEAGVNITRIIEILDKEQSIDNSAFRRRPSVRMEEVLHYYQKEERATAEAARAGAALLLKRYNERETI